MAVRYSDIVIGDNNCKNIILFFCDSNKILYKTSFNGFFCLLLAFKNGENFFLRDFRFILYNTDVNLAAKAMRAHWSIENNLHWVLDTVFDEDYCRVRKYNSVHNFNIIIKLVMNLLKGLDLPVATKKKNLTIGNKQTLCLKNEKCLLYALQNL